METTNDYQLRSNEWSNFNSKTLLIAHKFAEKYKDDNFVWMNSDYGRRIEMIQTAYTEPKVLPLTSTFDNVANIKISELLFMQIGEWLQQFGSPYSRRNTPEALAYTELNKTKSQESYVNWRRECKLSAEEIDSRSKLIKKYADILHSHYCTLLMLVVDEYNTQGSSKHSSMSDARVVLSVLLKSLTSLSDHCTGVINKIPGILLRVLERDIEDDRNFWNIKDPLLR